MGAHKKCAICWQSPPNLTVSMTVYETNSSANNRRRTSPLPSLVKPVIPGENTRQGSSAPLKIVVTTSLGSTTLIVSTPYVSILWAFNHHYIFTQITWRHIAESPTSSATYAKSLSPRFPFSTVTLIPAKINIRKKTVPLSRSPSHRKYTIVPLISFPCVWILRVDVNPHSVLLFMPFKLAAVQPVHILFILSVRLVHGASFSMILESGTWTTYGLDK